MMHKEELLNRTKSYSILTQSWHNHSCQLLEELNPELKEKIKPIYAEGNELLSIIVAALRTLRGN